MKQFQAGQLKVKIMDSRDEMGRVAGKEAAECLRRLLKEKEQVNVIFAAAPSQDETLHYLALEEGIDWKRVNAFHMDEYIGLPEGAKQAFSLYLTEHIFGKVPFGQVFLLNPQARDAQAECERYAALLREYPTDMVCLGIGENGHIAFNDPWVADFEDEKLVKVVPLDPVCRQQQVNDGCFAKLEDVPENAITLTIPALTKAAHLFCTVPAATKRWAVNRTINGSIDEECPATIMRKHSHAVLYCDSLSGADLL